MLLYFCFVIMAVSPNNVTVNVGALSNALAVAIQQATSNSSSSPSVVRPVDTPQRSSQ